MDSRQNKVAFICMPRWCGIILTVAVSLLADHLKIVKTINPVIEAAGGTILINAEVDKVIIENNIAKGVKMSDNKYFYAKYIISNAGIMNTYNKLLAEKIVKKHQLK